MLMKLNIEVCNIEFNTIEISVFSILFILFLIIIIIF